MRRVGRRVWIAVAVPVVVTITTVGIGLSLLFRADSRASRGRGGRS